MLRRIVIAGFVSAIVTSPAPLRAELRYIVVTLDRSAPRPGWKPPEDRTDTYIVGQHGARLESTHVDEFMPAGGVMLGLPDGTVIVLDPAKRTYWKYPPLPRMPTGPAAAGTVGALMKPDVSSSSAHTGEFEAILGIRCERITWETTMKLPSPPAGTPIQFSAALTTSGDVWTTDRFPAYAGLAERLLNPGAAGLRQMLTPDAFVPEGFVMRKITRVAGVDSEESLVTSLIEADVPADLFSIPAGYTEVPFPDANLLKLLQQVSAGSQR